MPIKKKQRRRPTLTKSASKPKPTKKALSADFERDAPIQSKTFSWKELRVGDCHQKDGKITFYSNGTGVWHCTTWTDHTHSGDTWSSMFHAETPADGLLFSVGFFESGSMDDGDPPPQYGWGAQFTFPAYQFGEIGKVEQEYSC